MQTHRAIRAVAAFEAFKGLLALAAASGLFLLLHKDLRNVAITLVEHAHLNPAAHYPSIFIVAAEHLQNTRFRLIALGAAAYSSLRFVEAYGLFREAVWAEVLAAVSGAIYIPFEVIEIMRRPGWLSVGALVVNLAVVAIMVVALLQRRKARAENAA
ncbi:MAG: DUF2127 domain-containing protein [Porticoccaceae bacterium]